MIDLTGKNALVTGIANNRSIAWGIAQQLHKAGANLGITYLKDEPLNPSLYLPCNVQDESEIESTFKTIADKWGKLDILVHCLAFAGKDELSGDFTNTSRQGFSNALDISAYSLVRLCAAAKPLMAEGGSIITLTYLGGVRVVIMSWELLRLLWK
jgi:enoyl-[acyl-carrier protein] reductase I